MKRTSVALLILAIALTGMVSAAAVGGDTGYYEITSTPAGAAVTVDGTPAGTTPATASIYTTGTPGHTIVVTKAGYEPWSQYFTGNPAAGQHIAVHASLVPIPETPHPGSEKGFYRVYSEPSGASVVFDGVNYGLTPVTISVVSTGTPGHSITVSRSGYQTWSQYYPGNPAGDQTIQVFATLSPVVQSGSIHVNSVPAGSAAILDNGYDQITTPGTFTGVSAGWHSIRVSKSGYQPWSTSIQVKPGETSTVNAPLVPNQQSGSLSITSSPAAADLYVDSIYQGLTSQIVGNLAPGPHTVILRKSGYQDSSQTVTVRSAETTSLSVTLSPLVNPAIGDLDVSSSPSGASVFINGDYRGETRSAGPLYITAIPPGTYTIVLKKSGFNEYSTTTQVVAGMTAQVTAVLSPSAASPAVASAEIFSQPSGADVFINNVFTGITPLSLDRVPVDTNRVYTVEIRMAGYTPYSTSGTLNPGQSVVINAALAALPVPTTMTPLSPAPVIAGLAVMGFLYGMLLKRR